MRDDMQSRRGAVRSTPRTAAERAPLVVSPRHVSTTELAQSAPEVAYAQPVVQPVEQPMVAPVSAPVIAPIPAPPATSVAPISPTFPAFKQPVAELERVLLPEPIEDMERTSTPAPVAAPGLNPQPSPLPPPLPVELVMRDIPAEVLAAKVAPAAAVKQVVMPPAAARRAVVPLQDIKMASQPQAKASKDVDQPRVAVESVGVHDLAPALNTFPVVEQGRSKLKKASAPVDSSSRKSGKSRSNAKSKGGVKKKASFMKRLLGRS